MSPRPDQRLGLVWLLWPPQMCEAKGASTAGGRPRLGGFTPLQLLVERYLKAAEGKAWTSHQAAPFVSHQTARADPARAQAACVSATSLFVNINTVKVTEAAGLRCQQLVA